VLLEVWLLVPQGSSDPLRGVIRARSVLVSLRGKTFLTSGRGGFPPLLSAWRRRIRPHNECVGNPFRHGLKAEGQFRFTCASCGGVAATLSVMDTEQPVDAGPLPDGTRLSWTPEAPSYRFEFLGVTTGKASAALADLVSGLDELDPLILSRVDQELAAFCCTGCQRNYCATCWSTWIDFDEGFYDCTWGRCPQGHEQMLDD
jgi:hypothetical protein